MADPTKEVPVRKRIITYGKTKRKIISENGCKSTSHISPNKLQAAREKCSKNESTLSAFTVEGSEFDFKQTAVTVNSSKDIYDISSDEDSLKSKTPSLFKSKFAQTNFKSGSLIYGVSKNIDREQVIPIHNVITQPSLKKELTDIFGLPKITNQSSHSTGMRLGNTKISGSSQSTHNISSNVKATRVKVRSKQNIHKVSGKLEGKGGLRLVKNKFAKSPTKPRNSTISTQTNEDIYHIPSSDDEEFSLEASQKMSAPNHVLNSQTAECQYVAITKKGSKKKLKLSPSNETSFGTRLFSGSNQGPLTLCDTETHDKMVGMPSRSLPVKESYLYNNYQVGTTGQSVYHGSRISSPIPSLDEMKVNEKQKEMSPKSQNIWKDLLSHTNSEDLGMFEDSNVARSTISVTSSFKFDTDLAKPFQITDVVQNGTQTPRRLRMIDFLIQKTTNSSSSNDSLSEETESDEESVSVELDSTYTPLKEKRCTSIEKETAKPPTIAPESHSAMLLQGLEPKFTYSHQRSMLAEEDLAIQLAQEFSMPIQLNGDIRNRRGSIPKLEPLLNLCEEEEEDGGQSIIKNVHELRKSGVIKRFLDECVDLFDRIGLPGEKVSSRRSGLLGLALRMRDIGFMQQFRANCMEQQLFLGLDKENDTISGFLILCILVSILREGFISHLMRILCRQGIAQLLGRLINDETSIPEICKCRNTNMSQMTQSLMIEYYNHFLKSSVWEGFELEVLSARTITVKCLYLMAQKIRESELLCDIFSQELTAKLFSIMKSVSLDESWEPSKNKRAIDLALAVECLQTRCNAAPNFPDEPKWIEEHLPLLADVLEQSLSRPQDLFDAHITILKMTLQLTNNNQSATEVFARPSLLLLLSTKLVHQFHAIHRYQTEKEFPRILDHLSLLLGILMNFSEWSPHVRDCLQEFHKLEVDPLEEMISIFEERSEDISQAESEQETLKNVVLGYLAVTLGFLSQLKPIRQRISSQRKKLLGCIEEFILIHKLADRNILSGNDTETTTMIEIGGEYTQIEAQKELTERFENLVKQLKSSDSPDE